MTRMAPFIVVACLAYPALVWPLFEAEVVSLAPVFGQPAVDGPPSALLRIYFSVLLFAGCISFASSDGSRTVRLLQPPILLTALYLGWAGTTSLWSVEPDITLRRFLLGVFIAGSLITATLTVRDPAPLLRNVFWMFFSVTVLSAYSVLTTPPTALGHAAFYPHKNYFGATISVAALVALYQLSSGRGVTRIAAALMLPATAWFLIEARSKTSLALVVAAPLLGYAVALSARVLRISPAIAFGAIGASLYAVYAIGTASHIWDFDDVATAIFGDPTLTQRTDIWAFAIKMIEQRPWLGYGYEVFWGASVESPSVRQGPGFVAQMPHAHNGYIDIVLQTGYIGLAIFAVLLLSTLHLAGRIAQRSLGQASFLLSIIFYCVLSNGLETSWFRSFGLSSMMFVLAIALTAQGQVYVQDRGRADAR
jgi:exopolysaccharide production protein ExoQ